MSIPVANIHWLKGEGELVVHQIMHHQQWQRIYCHCLSDHCQCIQATSRALHLFVSLLPMSLALCFPSNRYQGHHSATLLLFVLLLSKLPIPRSLCHSSLVVVYNVISPLSPVSSSTTPRWTMTHNLDCEYGGLEGGEKMSVRLSHVPCNNKKSKGVKISTKKRKI